MAKAKTSTTCRFCNNPLSITFVDLGVSPVANAMIPADQSEKPEMYYPLHVFICEKCLLVQIPNTVRRDAIFNDKYTYFSSFSPSWLIHAKKYVENIIARLHLTNSSFVVELASNDGYLLQYFRDKKIPVLGVEPSANVASEAIKKKIPTLVKFFGVDTAKEIVKKGKKADLIIANNVLAHVPDINDFVGGIKLLLSEDGVVTAEFPSVVNLIEKNQFDTIYHEHYSYYSFTSIERIFNKHGIVLFDVEQIETHGGSLRIYGKLKESHPIILDSVNKMNELEKKGGYKDISGYYNYNDKLISTKMDFLEFLIREKRKGKSVIGYGAAAKGNTFLNYCGVGTEFIDYVVDDSPFKQNHLLPGSRIPVYGSERIKKTKPDFIVILPWNIKKPISTTLGYIKKWGGKCVVAIPKLEIMSI